ncbi:hypothetical protein DER46DRAFT_608417 [Fusarium sp. MPI-SDFR-AT-0072]|nr:hypothetical protein DER46DRAFT_608417 [Fusarium sp. MPI-SDFR-AT-0072]
MSPLWKKRCTGHGVPSENLLCAFRDHSIKIAAPNRESLGMLRNTFLMLHSDWIWPELDTVH